jgi:integrase
MATITRRGAGQWQAKVRKKGHPAISETFPTRKEAEDWATDVEAKMRRNVFLDMREAERTTLHDALDRYKREVTCKKKGAAQESGRIARWQRDPLALKSLAALTSTDLAAWRDRRLAARTSPTTVRTDLSLLSALYKTAEREWRLTVINPLRLVTMPRPAEGRKRRLNAATDEEKRLLGACREIRGGGWLAPLIRLALATAARTGELLALRWQDIDFGNETIRFNETKGGGSRTIPLFDDALEVLNELRGGID